MKKAWTIWFTGLHGSGKSTIAGNLAAILRSKNVPCVLIDGDEVRKTVSADLGYSMEERNEHMRRVANICKIISENGVISIASVASPTESSRDYAKNTLKKMFLVYVKCTIEICEKKDVKGHYKNAKKEKKGFEHFINVSVNFEEPKNPDVILNTDKESVEESVKKLVEKMKRTGLI